jgi:hypothetical protein
MVVQCHEDYDDAASFLKACGDLKKEINATMQPIVADAHRAHKTAKSKQKELLAPVEAAVKVIGRKMGDYQAQCERQRKAEEAMLLAQAKKEQEESALEFAEALEEGGNGDVANAMLENIPDIQVRAESFAPRVSGTVTRTTWLFEIVDASMLPLEYMMPDEKAIRAMVKAKKGDTAIPGVRAYSETTVGARG